jgi:hypothetical protein
MNLDKMSSYNRLDILKKKFFLKKVWFVTNAFVFLPLITWIFFVWLGPIVDADKLHPALSAWLQFWGIVATVAEMIKDKIESIEWSISNK